MIQCSMLDSLLIRCRNSADVQARVESVFIPGQWGFVLACCADSECLSRYSATVREFRRNGARVVEAKLPYAAVVALKQGETK